MKVTIVNNYSVRSHAVKCPEFATNVTLRESFKSLTPRPTYHPRLYLPSEESSSPGWTSQPGWVFPRETLEAVKTFFTSAEAELKEVEAVGKPKAARKPRAPKAPKALREVYQLAEKAMREVKGDAFVDEVLSRRKRQALVEEALEVTKVRSVSLVGRTQKGVARMFSEMTLSPRDLAKTLRKLSHPTPKEAATSFWESRVGESIEWSTPTETIKATWEDLVSSRELRIGEDTQVEILSISSFEEELWRLGATTTPEEWKPFWEGKVDSLEVSALVESWVLGRENKTRTLTWGEVTPSREVQVDIRWESLEMTTKKREITNSLDLQALILVLEKGKVAKSRSGLWVDFWDRKKGSPMSLRPGPGVLGVDLTWVS